MLCYLTSMSIIATNLMLCADISKNILDSPKSCLILYFGIDLAERIAMVGFITMWTLGCLLYLLPTIIAWNKRNLAAIFALNFLLGWTFIGWVGALVWALTHERKN